MNFNIILHATTSCNFDCSYCDVIKDKKRISPGMRDIFLNFLQRNQQKIGRVKFFGGEPLLAFRDIQYIIDHSHQYIGNRFEIVTNTSLLQDDVGIYFEKYFELIFFSIDTENLFQFDKVIDFVERFHIEKKLYFNLIISPGSSQESLDQFLKLYERGMRGFNILPVYFTKPWYKNELADFSRVLQKILDITKNDSSLRLYGFQENIGYTASLINMSLFVDIDGKLYYSDIVSTRIGQSIKNDLFFGSIQTLNISELENLYNFDIHAQKIKNLESIIQQRVPGQLALQSIMNYGSTYLNYAG